ncbi:MAG: alpha/beta hydrolase [Actinomycetota bacterium]
MQSRIIPGAEAFRFDAGPIGALLQHGFTGSPASMHPMGRWLADHGISVLGPRLPGHGTTWEDLERTTWQDWERESEAALLELSSRCTTVIAAGLSMGGAMVLHLAAKHPERLKGVVVVNPDVRRPELALTPLLRLFTRSTKGVGNDIKKPGQDEIVYERVPLKAANQLGRFYRRVQRELPSVRQPLLVFSSPEDHVAKPANSRYVLEHAGSDQKELVTLTNSYHVATLDYDAELIFERTLRFASATANQASSPSA